jgi:hypothetical protein
MATTTNTLPHDTYANQTTPLWATAAAGQQFNSPSVVKNDVDPATAGLTTFVSDDISTASLTFNTIPIGTALNEIVMGGVTDGITLLTNGEPTMNSRPGETAVVGDLAITSRQTGGTWVFNNNELSYNGVKQLTGDATYSQLGENTYSDQYGLNVWNVNSSNKTTTLSDREIYFTTTTPGTTTTNTYDFISTLVPNQTTANPLVRDPNTRTPQPYQDAYFSTYGASTTITTSPTKPYLITVENTGATNAYIGARLQLTSTPDDWIKAGEFPLWFEFDLFDPGIYRYSFINQGAGFGQTGLLTDIRNTAGVLTFEAIGSGTPTTYTAGDFITIIYEWIDKPTGQAKVTIAKNNVFVSSSPTGLTTASDVIPLFASISAVAPGFFFNLNWNWGTTSKIISSFNGWEWTTGLGGLYPIGNTALRPLASGSSPPGNLYNSVFLLGGCDMTSPPISAGVGQTITIAAYKGEKIGSGTLRIFQNTVNLIYSGGVGSAWSSGAITTAVSTGSDTFTFQYISATDILSLQRIQISYNAPVDVLDGGMGMNGTLLNVGQGNYYSAPTMSFSSSNISVTKPINMNANTISNATFSGTSTGTFVGNVQTNSITPISPATYTAIGNFDLNTNTLSRGTIRPFNIGNSAPFSNVVMLCPLNMNNQNILQANTINSETILNQGGIDTFGLTSSNINSTNAGTNLLIGSNSFQVNLSNVGYLYGRGQFAPMLINMVDTINQVSACATGGIYIQTNFGGFRQLMIPLVPTWSRSTTECYILAGDNYTATDGYLLAGKTELVIYDQFLTVLSVHTNNVDTPRTFLNTDLILNTPNRLYTYRPYLAGL